ncbi:hypothetical protein D3C85_1660890 [compost metagenome]
MRTARDVSEICKATLAGGVVALYQRADVAKRLAVQADDIAELKARVAALEAGQASMERRQEITESGEHWHDIARRMRSEGASYGVIAQSTGQKLDTVKKHIRRSA